MAKVEIIVDAVTANADKKLDKTGDRIDALQKRTAKNLESLRKELKRGEEGVITYTKTTINWGEALRRAGSIATGASAAFSFINKELEKTVKLAEEKPELFTDQELRMVENYADAMSDFEGNLRSSWVVMRAMEAMTGGTSALARFGEGIRSLRRGEFRDWAADIVNEAKGIVTPLEEAAEAAASFDRAIMNQQGIRKNLIPSLQDASKEFKAMRDAINDAIKEQNAFYTNALSTLPKLKSQREQQVQSERDLTAELLKQKDETIALQIAQGNLARTNKKWTAAVADEYWDLSIAIGESEFKVYEIEQALNDLKDSSQDTFNQMVFDGLQAKLMMDGIISDAEYLFLLQEGKRLGMFTEADVKTFQDVNTEVSNIAARAPTALTPLEQGFFAVKEPMQDVYTLMRDIASMDGTRVSFGVDFFTTGMLPSPTSLTNPAAFGMHSGFRGTRASAGGFLGNNADGGMFTVPGRGNKDLPFTIGLTPGETVQVTPRGEQPQGVVNIYVDSVRNLSDLDYLAQEIKRRIT